MHCVYQTYYLFPGELLGSLYQRSPERYSLSVGLSWVSERLGLRCAQATSTALINAVGAAYEPRNEGLATEATK